MNRPSSVQAGKLPNAKTTSRWAHIGHNPQRETVWPLRHPQRNNKESISPAITSSAMSSISRNNHSTKDIRKPDPRYPPHPYPVYHSPRSYIRSFQSHSSSNQHPSLHQHPSPHALLQQIHNLHARAERQADLPPLLIDRRCILSDIRVAVHHLFRIEPRCGHDGWVLEIEA